MYMLDITPEQVDEAMPIVEALTVELLSKVVGKSLPSWRCNCGECGAGPAVVVSVSGPRRGYYPEMCCCGTATIMPTRAA